MAEAAPVPAPPDPHPCASCFCFKLFLLVFSTFSFFQLLEQFFCSFLNGATFVLQFFWFSLRAFFLLFFAKRKAKDIGRGKVKCSGSPDPGLP